MEDKLMLLGGGVMKLENGKLYLYNPREEPKVWYDKYGVLHAVPPKYNEEEEI